MRVSSHVTLGCEKLTLKLTKISFQVCLYGFSIPVFIPNAQYEINPRRYLIIDYSPPKPPQDSFFFSSCQMICPKTLFQCYSSAPRPLTDLDSCFLSPSYVNSASASFQLGPLHIAGLTVLQALSSTVTQPAWLLLDIVTLSPRRISREVSFCSYGLHMTFLQSPSVCRAGHTAFPLSRTA